MISRASAALLVLFFLSAAASAAGSASSAASAKSATPAAAPVPLGLLNSIPSAPVNLPPVPQKTVQAAVAQRIMHFNRSFKGGAHTDAGYNGGSPMVLALAAWQGDASADAAFLQQIRSGVIAAKSSPSANGGYPSQHELLVTSALAVARMTPRLWNQLSPDEKFKVALVMKATLVGSAFTTSDASGGIKNPVALDGDDNLNRGWLGNYAEGMFGNLIAASVFFGGPVQAARILDSYDHDAFVAQLKAAGLSNTYDTFNWKAAHPDSRAPDGKTIAAGVRNYRYLGQPLADPMTIYYNLTVKTYGATVGPGLNGGKGFAATGAGRLVSGADTLPNLGKTGMLHELDGLDAGGPRSSVAYAYTGFRPNLLSQLAILLGSYWKPGPQADECLARLDVGITDLFYKLEHGYLDYSKGHASAKPIDTHSWDAEGWSYGLTRSLWYDVLKPYHAAQKK